MDTLTPRRTSTCGFGTAGESLGGRKMTTVKIRPYTAGDEQSVLALWAESLADGASHNHPQAVLRQKLAHERDLLFVAVESGRVIGTVMGGFDGHRGWVYAVAVEREHRRLGVGTALVRHLEQALAERGCLKVNLQVR